MLAYPVNVIIQLWQRSSAVERSLRKGEVGGSSPPVGSKRI